MATAERIQVLPNVKKVMGPSSPSKTPHQVNLNSQNDKIVREMDVNVKVLILIIIPNKML